MASEKWVSKGGVACELDTTFNAQKYAELCRYFLEPVLQDTGPHRTRAHASVGPTRHHDPLHT